MASNCKGESMSAGKHNKKARGSSASANPDLSAKLNVYHKILRGDDEKEFPSLLIFEGSWPEKNWRSNVQTSQSGIVMVCEGVIGTAGEDWLELPSQFVVKYLKNGKTSTKFPREYPVTITPGVCLKLKGRIRRERLGQNLQ